MDWCDTSAVDWEAVGALGTWAVGIAAAFLAFQANRLGKRLRDAQHANEERTARAVVSGLRVEVLHYAIRLKGLGESLARHARASNAGAHAVETFTSMEALRLSDINVPAISHLPSELSERLSRLFGQVQSSKQMFANSAHFMKKLAPDHPELPDLIDRAAFEAKSVANGAFDVLDLLTKYLRLPPDPDYRNGALPTKAEI